MSKLDIEATKFKRRYSNYRDQLPDIGHENGVFVFPYNLRSGYLNRTESGYVWSDDKVDEHNFFQKLITGKDNINVVWEDSTILTKPKGVNRYYYKFEVGKYYLGEIIGNEVFANTQFYDDELGQKNIKVNNTVVLHFVYNKENDEEENFPDLRPFHVEKEDMFKLYKIPQLFGEEWMYISDVRYETIPNDNEIVGCFITFVSLNEQLSKSGRTIESYIHESAPNEPYAKPLLSVKKNEKGEVLPCVELDENAKNFDRKMVKHIQIEIYGTNALSAITIIGRRLKKDEEGKPYFTNWQFLYPYSFIKSKTYDLEKTSTPSNNFFVFPKCNLDFTKSIGWIEQWKKASDVVATNNFTGVLMLGKSDDWVEDVHKSNPINTSSTVINGLHFDYWSLAWKPFQNLNVSQPYDLTKDNPYCVNNLWFTQNDSFLDILIKNSFIYWQQLELPLGFYSTKPYRRSDIPIMGGMIAALAGDRTIFSNKSRKKTIPLCCIIDCAAATCGANILVGGEGSIWDKAIPLSFFGGEEVPKFLGVDVCNTTLCFSLTHLLIDSDNNEWDTSYLGQSTNENLEPLFDDAKKVFQYDGTQKPKETDECYIIDKVIIQGLIKSDIKITFFDENKELANPLWTTKVQSQGKYTNSLRNWTTEITTGCWNDKYVEFIEKFTWPEDPPFGIIYNQKPNYNPYITTRDVNGKYEMSLKKNDSRIFNDVGEKDVKTLWDGKIKINYADLDPTQEKIYNEATFKEKVLSMSFSLNYSFSLIASTYWEGMDRINKSDTKIMNVDAKGFSKTHFSLPIFDYSNEKNYFSDDSIEFLEKNNTYSYYPPTISISGGFNTSETTWYNKIFSIACNDKSLFYDDELWHRCGFVAYFQISNYDFKQDGVEIESSLILELIDLDHIGFVNTRPYICFYLLQKSKDANFYNVKIEKESLAGTLTILCGLQKINFEIKQDDDEEE